MINRLARGSETFQSRRAQMTKHQRISIAEYKDRLALVRHYTTGFYSRDGYDMRKATDWSSAKKAQITRYYKFIIEINSQEKHFYRPVVSGST